MRALLLGLAMLTNVACAGRVVESAPIDASHEAPGDAGAAADLGPYSGDAWWEKWDAPVFETPPSVGMYPPNGEGPCDVTGCANAFSACLPAQGWCCGGSLGGPYPCSCGRELGCRPPYVCCPYPLSGERRCKLEKECTP
jgi:hypothetical protein